MNSKEIKESSFFCFDKAKNSINVVRCSLNLIQKVSETKTKRNKSNKKKQTLLKQQDKGCTSCLVLQANTGLLMSS